MTVEKCVKIWAFHDAPKEYRDLSGHGGDEDWIVFIPSGTNIWPVVWMFEDDSYVNGWGHVDRHKLDDGEIIIFAHA